MVKFLYIPVLSAVLIKRPRKTNKKKRHRRAVFRYDASCCIIHPKPETPRVRALPSSPHRTPLRRERPLSFGSQNGAHIILAAAWFANRKRKMSARLQSSARPFRHVMIHSAAFNPGMPYRGLRCVKICRQLFLIRRVPFRPHVF